jgi:hypothetical protein
VFKGGRSFICHVVNNYTPPTLTPGMNLSHLP